MGAVGCAAELAAIRAVPKLKRYRNIDRIIQQGVLAQSGNPNFRGAGASDGAAPFVGHHEVGAP